MARQAWVSTSARDEARWRGPYQYTRDSSQESPTLLTFTIPIFHLHTITSVVHGHPDEAQRAYSPRGLFAFEKLAHDFSTPPTSMVITR